MRYPSRHWRRRKKKDTKKVMLNMRDKELFLWDLNEILKGLEDQSMAESIAATVYSKASRLGIDEAMDYVESMLKEGALDETRARRIRELLIRNSMRR